MRIHLGLVVFGIICHISPVSAQETKPTSDPTNSEVLLKTTDDRANDTSARPILQERPATTPQAPSRLQWWLEDTIGPRSLVVTAIPAFVKIVAPPDHYPREWRQGVGGASRNFGDAVASSLSVQTTTHSLAAVLHQDLRYRRSGRRNFFGRFSYAVAETFVYRTDGGIVLPNFANLAGAATGGYVTRLYLPPGFNDVSHANTRMEYQFGTIMATNVLTEFGRSLYKFSHRTHIPFIQSVPEWWTNSRK